MATLILRFASIMGGDRGQVAAGLRRRDPDLLAALIEQYQYRLFRYLRLLTRNQETAEDLFQETWMRVMNRGDQYNGKSSFESWLFAIARNLVIDLQRRKKPDRLDSLMEATVASEEPSPFESATERQRSDRMRESLEQLPAVHREVLMLRFHEEMELTEIATIVEVPLSTVKSRLYRGLELLRQSCGGIHED